MLPETPGRVVPAKVVRTAGAIDPASRTLLTELEVDNARGEILAGSFGQVRFNHARVDAALTLPATTLLYRSAGPQVGVVGANGAVAVRSVTLGRDFGSTLEVLGGVSASDQVIINPPDALADGMQVKVGGAGAGAVN
jgi:multidrug efflux pump subunit AcrA (membrane-fusion protein)